MTTAHGLERAKERMGMNKKVATRQIQLAWERGKSAENFNSWERDFLSREKFRNRKVVAYNGYCYIFTLDGYCLTMYPLPEWFGKKKAYDGKKRIRNYKTYYKNNYNPNSYSYVA